jgi:hypothetical protein
MFLSAIVLALIAGTLAGGGLPRLADLKLRSIWILGLALPSPSAPGCRGIGATCRWVPSSSPPTA